tara:strand:+ start:159 stop:701 length:543 start_codon:yes stop_codon:yes gene_type:complete
MAQQTKTITSESLEAAYRALTPSQSGFTEDLMASNTIIPVLDLTASAEGTSTPEFLQRAWDFSTGHVTISTATTTNIISNTGFWQVGLTTSHDSGNSARSTTIQISDGLSVKPIWELNKAQVGVSDTDIVVQDRFVCFLRAGDTLQCVTASLGTVFCDVWYRQVADINGTLTNPLGFTPQ